MTWSSASSQHPASSSASSSTPRDDYVFSSPLKPLYAFPPPYTKRVSALNGAMYSRPTTPEFRSREWNRRLVKEDARLKRLDALRQRLRELGRPDLTIVDGEIVSSSAVGGKGRSSEEEKSP